MINSKKFIKFRNTAMDHLQEHITHPDLRTRRQIGTWLLIGYGMVFIMLVLGGITRLTQSGLSIVEWNVIMGVVPPLNDNDWNTAFEKYQQFPEYKIMNKTMSVDEFKNIFWWEFIHRLWGRLIGIVFIIPFVLFIIQKKLNAGWIRKMIGVFLIGAFQGFIGWYMVKSGLIENPHVSHYRLTMHLFLAFSICGLLLWYAMQWLSETTETKATVKRFLSKSITWLTVLILLQAMLGGLVAGLKAGFMFNTYPKMGDNWLPEAAWMMDPVWMNFLENGVMIQFMHRTLALIVVAGIAAFWLKTRKMELPKQIKNAISLMILMGLVQLILGVVTLLLVVPVFWGVVHQAGALVLFSIAVWTRYQIKTWCAAN
jgi:cytochrome c oxidase assembly protein subunit 15